MEGGGELFIWCYRNRIYTVIKDLILFFWGGGEEYHKNTLGPWNQVAGGGRGAFRFLRRCKSTDCMIHL